MKTLVATVAIGLLLAFGTIAIADHHEGKAWFDVEKCALCKHMGDHQKMMSAMKWEVHPTKQGMISIAMVPEEHQAEMKKLHQQIEAEVTKLESGQEMQLCGFCDSYGELMAKGAEEQQIETSFGMVTLVTSDDPETAVAIQKHAKRAMKEYQAIKDAMEKSGE